MDMLFVCDLPFPPFFALCPFRVWQPLLSHHYGEEGVLLCCLKVRNPFFSFLDEMSLGESRWLTESKMMLCVSGGGDPDSDVVFPSGGFPVSPGGMR